MLASVVMFSFLIFSNYIDTIANINFDNAAELELQTIIILSTAVFIFSVSALKITFAVLHHIFLRYYIKSNQLIVVKGVFLQRFASFPLERIFGVQVCQSFIDLIFGLYNIDVVTAASEQVAPLRIAGLDRTSAYGLEEFLMKAISERSQQVPQFVPIPTAQAAAM